MWMRTMRHHEIRAPAMQGANEPAQRDVVIQRLKAVPRLPRRRHVDQRQQNSGDQLQEEDRQRSAAEHIQPACACFAGPDVRPLRGSALPSCRRASNQAPIFRSGAWRLSVSQ